MEDEDDDRPVMGDVSMLDEEDDWVAAADAAHVAAAPPDMLAEDDDWVAAADAAHVAAAPPQLPDMLAEEDDWGAAADAAHAAAAPLMFDVHMGDPKVNVVYGPPTRGQASAKRARDALKTHLLGLPVNDLTDLSQAETLSCSSHGCPS